MPTDPTSRPFAFRPGEGEVSYQQGGQMILQKASGDSTSGSFALLEVVSTKGASPPLHVHEREDEAFYILEGEVRVYLGDEILTAREGSWVFAPRRVPHGYVVCSETARHLSFILPAGFENFFEAVERESVAAGGVTPALMSQISQQFGVTILGPPAVP